MTTLRKKREFKKSLKKENNKASKKKLRKRSKNKISKKRLLARNKLGGSNDANVVLQRVISGTRDPNDIYKVLLTIGIKFVNEYNSHYDPKIELRHRGTRISKDRSVYLTIQFASPVNGQKLEIFHLSDHPGISTSHCGAIHIKQFHRFNGEPLNKTRCFKIVPHTTQKTKLSLSTISSSEDEDFRKLKNFIENISQNDIIQLGLYARFTEQQLNDLGSPVGKGRENTPDSVTGHSNTPVEQRNFQLDDYDGTVRKINFGSDYEFPTLPSK